MSKRELTPEQWNDRQQALKSLKRLRQWQQGQRLQGRINRWALVAVAVLALIYWGTQ